MIAHPVGSIVRDVAAIVAMVARAGASTLCMTAASGFLTIAERTGAVVAMDAAKGCMALARWVDPALRH